MAAFRRKEYPENWKEIRVLVLQRANYKCEKCGVKDRSIGARDRFGEWHDASEIESLNSSVGFHLFGADYPKYIRIVLTCHHTCRDKSCDDMSHLEALCQKCHLAEERETARDGRRRKKEGAQPCLTGL